MLNSQSDSPEIASDAGGGNRSSLHGTPGQVGFAPAARRGRRDDKGEGGASPQYGWR
jgi:hypothetical protein